MDCILKLEEYVSDVTEAVFETNSEKQDAAIRRIEIIGEAAKKISNRTRERYDAVSRKEMAGMRDMVIHQYFGVSTALVWKVATSELPILKEKNIGILEDLND